MLLPLIICEIISDKVITMLHSNVYSHKYCMFIKLYVYVT
jgi:hypothetical protein